MPSITLPVALLGGAVVAGGTANAIIGSNAAHDAANAQVQGANTAAGVETAALKQQQAQFDTTQANLQPWMDTGKNALSTLYDSLVGGPNAGKFQSSPGYQFAFDQGTKAVNANASARGLSMSGNRLKDLTTFGTGIADQDYNNWLSQLGTVAGFGQNANNTSATVANANSNAIGNNANQVANIDQSAAAARASGYVGGANALSGAISGTTNNLASLYGMSQSGYVGQSNGPWNNSPLNMVP